MEEAKTILMRGGRPSLVIDNYQKMSRRTLHDCRWINSGCFILASVDCGSRVQPRKRRTLRRLCLAFGRLLSTYYAGIRELFGMAHDAAHGFEIAVATRLSEFTKSLVVLWLPADHRR